MALPLNCLEANNSRLLEEKILKQYESEILQRPDSHVNLTSIDFVPPEVSLTYGFGPVVPKTDEKVFFFDIDNCLYKRSTKVHDLMQIYIHRFFTENLQLDDEEAHRLHHKYYKEYGLAIEGLVRHHKINAIEYNKLVDDALPLDKILKPNLELREMLIKMKKLNKVKKLWLFTNAYKNHGLRVIKLLGIGDLFDGMTFCDYEKFPMICKPMKAMFDQALDDAGLSDPLSAYFVDDSGLNTKAANSYGWGKVIQFVEREEDFKELRDKNAEKEGILLIRDILQLQDVCSELF